MGLQLEREDALASATAQASCEGFVLSELSQTQKGQPAGLSSMTVSGLAFFQGSPEPQEHMFPET